MDWLKIIASSLGLAELWSKYFSDKAKQDTGAKLQQGATDAATLATISAVNGPVSAAESQLLWERNKAKYAQPPEQSGANGGCKPG